MRRVRRRGGNKEKVFGCDLLEHLTASCQEGLSFESCDTVPQVLRCCSEFVEHHGIVDGIYRLSGVSSNIQKLRGEFESDGQPDLNKDVYLQDIHCVSSLCKAYFRELPNPLLTYQLYDKFAEAVAIQLEEERLVKISDVLKELPIPHYRTLEFLMRHLVRMASYSSETNMHARNLAIVWAPNLLRSKDIEATGFNGTAAFMEVRVQSIVVEFILTHVPQLFPEQDASSERRKSLPSPSALSNQDEANLFRSVPIQPVANFGNISPGDGPLPIRPYHAIIEGTDKRKGSLKGRKWMSIFNIGGRFPDPRRRHKHLVKEKERCSLRPARSMDSLSTPSYPNEGPRRSGQRPPSTHMTPLSLPSPQTASEGAAPSGALGGSGYAVTYRRGTGLVSGGGGTQGTYTALDPDSLGLGGSEALQSRSPGLSTKAGRRAAMHITGPTIVTVPLHITSNLALGVLQGGGSVIHFGKDKDGGDRVEGKEGGDRVEGKEGGDMVERKESRELDTAGEGGRKVEEEEKYSKGAVDMEESAVAADAAGEDKGEEAKEEEEEEEKEDEVREDCGLKPKLEFGGGVKSREQRTKSLNSNTDDDAVNNDEYVDDCGEYMEMKGVEPADPEPVATQPEDISTFEESDIINSTAVEGDDQELFGYVQDNFDFLDHMDCSVSYQVNEFSVEPPGHSDDEYEVMVQSQPAPPPAELQTYMQTRGPETRTRSQTELNPHRLLSLGPLSRHTKSLSLPYMTSPVHGPEESCSEGEDVEDNSNDDDDDHDDYSSEEDESMFINSLPADFFLNSQTGFELDTDTQDSHTIDRLHVNQSESFEEKQFETVNSEEPSTREQEQGEVRDEEDKERLEEEGKQIMNNDEEDALDVDQPEKHIQSKAAEEDLNITADVKSNREKPPASEESMHCCVAFPPPSNENVDELSTMEIDEEKQVDDGPRSDHPPHHTDSCATQETADLSSESGDHLRTCVTEDTEDRYSDEGEDGRVYRETNASQERVLEMKESNGDTMEDSNKEGKRAAGKRDEVKMHGVPRELSGSGNFSSEFWEELEDVVCEVIEDEENELAGRQGVARQGDVEKVGQEKEEKAENLGDETAAVEEEGMNKKECSKEESVETSEEKLVVKDTCSPEKSEIEEDTQAKRAINEDRQDHGRDVVSEEPEKENNDKQSVDEQLRSPPSVDNQVYQARSDMMCEKSDSSQGGVGRKLVISKHPKIYQVKAVPVVPPKPQHCKITAMTLRQQQQRERKDADRGRENMPKVCAADQGKDREVREREKKTDGDESTTSRSSPLGMCFEEAVAIATMRREKEKECEKERQRDWGSEVQ